jgi:hypothetical protein
MRYAIVTPYYKEPRALLERCIGSVARQTIQVDHILVADGYPQEWVASVPVRHIRLDRSHGDFGNTPRGIGSMLAIAEQYDGFGLLDADNWLEPDHVEACIRTFNSTSAHEKIDYVIAKRHLRRPDETIIPAQDEPNEEHVDTNCFFFFPPSYYLVPYFGTMPKELSPVCDRIFYQALRARGLKAAVCEIVTVNYHCLWECFYQSIGETPPEGAKPVIDTAKVQAWINAQSPQNVHLIQRLSGIIP